MNAIKRVAHAFKHTYNATLVRSIAYLPYRLVLLCSGQRLVLDW